MGTSRDTNLTYGLSTTLDLFMDNQGVGVSTANGVKRNQGSESDNQKNGIFLDNPVFSD
jgi:hypothetical protein